MDLKYCKKVSSIEGRPASIEEGRLFVGTLIYGEPKVGECFWLRRIDKEDYALRTSGVEEILSSNTFRTRNSIYEWGDFVEERKEDIERYYLLKVEIRCGNHLFQEHRFIRATTEKKEEAADDVVRDYYGENSDPWKEDEGWYHWGGELHVHVKSIKALDEIKFKILEEFI